jgi:5-methylcytosine-specific restriction protein A
MGLVKSIMELQANVDRLAVYLAEQDGPNREFAQGLVRRGIDFVVVRRDRRPFFAPSRFVGYRNNSRHAHASNLDKDGRKTTRAIKTLLGKRATPDARLEREYAAFCAGIDVTAPPRGAFAGLRKFWDLR